MFRIDAKVTALKMAISGQNVDRLIDGNARSVRVIGKLSGKSGEEYGDEKGE
jgi:hypothetical protein